jgi:hypothetical protein
VFLLALWAGREIEDVEPGLSVALRWIQGELNDAGCLGWKEPWGLIDALGAIDHPLARDIIRRQIPMLLRGQRGDGGWGPVTSFSAFQALHTHGFLDELHGLPPLPPDWRIVREVPAPAGKLFSLAWDARRLWVYDIAANEAIALSPVDGGVQERLSLPIDNAFAIGWWDGALGLSQRKPRRLLQVDPLTGSIRREVSLEDVVEWPCGFAQVDGELWVADGWTFCARAFDPDDVERRRWVMMPAPCGEQSYLAAAGEGIWHSVAYVPLLFRSDLSGGLLDWAEWPFEGHCDGLAWDGQLLWALDNEGRRVCAIERVEAG